MLGAQQLMEMVYQMVARTDEETMRFLNDVIILCAPANPDGMDLRRRRLHEAHGHDGRHPGALQLLRRSRQQPRLVHERAAGDHEHEPHHVSRVVPADHVQPSPDRPGGHGDVRAAVPRSVQLQLPSRDRRPTIDLIGVGHGRRGSSRKASPASSTRKGASYSTWWNGGLRTTAYFHNQIGILTETIGNPTPTSIPFNPTQFAVPNSSWWWPIAPQQVWHFRQSIDYSITANRAVLDFASRYRETNLYRIYQMGSDKIKWGNEDHWTFTPHQARRRVRGGDVAGGAAGGAGRAGGGAVRAAVAAAGAAAVACLATRLYAALHDARRHRDPRGFIMPSRRSRTSARPCGS